MVTGGGRRSMETPGRGRASRASRWRSGCVRGDGAPKLLDETVALALEAPVEAVLLALRRLGLPGAYVGAELAVLTEGQEQPRELGGRAVDMGGEGAGVGTPV